MTTVTGDVRASHDARVATRVSSDLLTLLMEKMQLLAAMHTYKFDCIEAGDNEAFELIEAMQRREASEIDDLRTAMRHRL
ncbi:MAG TPA: hypothetical protein VFY10_11675 [Dehalococcoidia bacterium]|nr:hypothetical protein [Dehalococcoidia bacterium]